MKGAKKKAATRPNVHVSIDVPELEAGLRFYGEVFGLPRVASAPGFSARSRC